MGTAADALRPYWTPGIHLVTGRAEGGFGEWLKDKTYQIYSPVSLNQFSLSISDPRPLRHALAADVCRLSSACLETVHSSDEPARTPKASAWFLIRAYYAAYYAGNAICRVLGTSVSQLEPDHTREVHVVASLFGQAPVPAIQSGLYECVVQPSGASVTCLRQSGTAGGAHELFWSCFQSLIRRIGNQILQSASILDQPVAAKMFDLATNLCLEGRNGGNWLSLVRNQVTYRHAKGAWFPYQSGIRRDTLRRRFDAWKDQPMKIELISTRDPSIERFVTTCAFLVALCREILEDVAQRCPRGVSFLTTGPHAYLNHVRSR